MINLFQDTKSGSLDGKENIESLNFTAGKKLIKPRSKRQVEYFNLVRGLDYYTHTAFEITSGALGSQATVCGGGRYDDLIKQMGGPNTPAIGFAIGLERLILLAGKELEIPRNTDIYIINQGLIAESLAWIYLEN